MEQKSILILQMGNAPQTMRDAHGDVPLWFCQLLGCELDDVEVIRVFEGEALPAPDPRRAAIITGSWAMVTDRLPWSEQTAVWIREAMAMEMPLFGVCYGHQLMAWALGGDVQYHNDGREAGTKTVYLNAAAAHEPLLAHLEESFPAHLTHRQTVTRLPIGATVLGASVHDPHQIVRYGPNAFSVQFHPEMRPEIATDLLRLNRPHIEKEGGDTDSLIAGVIPAPDAAEILRRFIQEAFRQERALSLRAAS
ncbi:glutamine amidotransferase [Kosakonia cowanii]|uniref:glutamine amidotransferase n=1 Tax=Kosakonia cowanii TaxID=208223 RepID=UPI0028B1BCA3|nr:glutamine amidotransferase [Kosakonia cowanii]WPG20441.1 glutamine amidotransferase [Kosakonia cowanii]